jgi:hypothetical protein
LDDEDEENEENDDEEIQTDDADEDISIDEDELNELSPYSRHHYCARTDLPMMVHLKRKIRLLAIYRCDTPRAISYSPSPSRSKNI